MLGRQRVIWQLRLTLPTANADQCANQPVRLNSYSATLKKTKNPIFYRQQIKRNALIITNLSLEQHLRTTTTTVRISIHNFLCRSCSHRVRNWMKATAALTRLKTTTMLRTHLRSTRSCCWRICPRRRCWAFRVWFFRIGYRISIC